MDQIKHSQFQCHCKQIILSDQPTIQQHIKTCNAFQKASPFQNLLNQMNIHKLSLEQLLLVQSDLLLQIERVEQEVITKQIEQMPVPNIELNKTVSEVLCIVCQKMKNYSNLHFLETCAHAYCLSCLKSKIKREYIIQNGVICCHLQNCNGVLQANEIEHIMGKEIDVLNQNSYMKNSSLVKCQQCQQQFLFEPGNKEDKVKDLNGKVLQGQQFDDFIQNRFTCLICKTEQCRSCKTIPFHLGLTCKDNIKLQLAPKCRFCKGKIDESNKMKIASPNKQVNNMKKKKMGPVANPPGEKPKVIENVCNSNECKTKYNMSCNKVLKCNHTCYGYKSETECLPCLHIDCSKDTDIDGEDFCNICYVESLNSAPCIQADCGHTFHLQCMQKRIQMRWSGPRINFEFLLCPLCKAHLKFKNLIGEIKPLLNDAIVLQEMVNQKAIERLKNEKRDQDERILQPGQYFNKQLEYAIHIYSYFECFSCKSPYFGGMRNCGDNIDENPLEQNKKFDPQELVCPSCCNIKMKADCKLHKTDYIDYKCRYCCSIALWFCWGTTHFCEPCHQKAWDLKKLSVKDIAQCKGKRFCPLHIDHPPNGEECPLGCSLCRSKPLQFQQLGVVEDQPVEQPIQQPEVLPEAQPEAQPELQPIVQAIEGLVQAGQGIEPRQEIEVQEQQIEMRDQIIAEKQE